MNMIINVSPTLKQLRNNNREMLIQIKHVHFFAFTWLPQAAVCLLIYFSCEQETVVAC
jgi:hypothetical protein